MKQYSWFFFVLIAATQFRCGEEEETPVYPGLPEEIRFVKISQSLYTSSATLIANGTNSTKFFLEFFDADHNPITGINAPTTVRLKVNGTADLLYPYRFQTTTPGTYTISLEGFAEGSVLNDKVLITAIPDKSYEPVVMPIIFHYIAPPDEIIGETQLSAVLKQNLAQLNRGFGNQDESPDPNAVNMMITFELAKEAPDGTPLSTPGLHVIKSESNVFADKADPKLDNLIWSGNYWSPRHYLNVWVCNFTDKYSYGNFPKLTPSASEFPDYSYGIFFNLSHFKTSTFNSVITHEAGHMLNLFHVFDPSCEADPDHCNDTQRYQREYDGNSFGSVKRSSCEDVSFISDNYMDYWPNEYNTFTYDQRERVRQTLELCAFLPTPKNKGLSGGRKRVGVSRPEMPHSTDPSQGTF